METTAEDAAPLSGPPKDAAGNGAATPPAADSGAAGAPKAASPAGARASALGQFDDLVAAVRRLEAFAADEAKRVSGKLVPQIETRAKQNIWVSLLLALGLGLILGVWLTGGRRRD